MPALTPTATALEAHVSKCPACDSWRWDSHCRVCQGPGCAGQDAGQGCSCPPPFALRAAS